jgi:hypothetical protein
MEKQFFVMVARRKDQKRQKIRKDKWIDNEALTLKFAMNNF